ncbi:30S ribosomal protein S1 [Candidatus Trichorickettsia mobilis]|uniref:30S ribosomal protein S1 n=1 Tax=Candidatus Trichorickettsia mobilis TaxID=1346319 RepID=A0ABZ0UW65_9RICK|nr:30S ribosomal protein S1 [Candidatus Trichorickettsia mobilis]WPY01149.1 30S ribosomal protein S1 [Candidatus Trichorickettsia mobilis]
MQKIKKRFIPQFVHLTESQEGQEDFAALLEQVNTSHVKEGTVVKGQVISVEKDVVVVDVGLKNEGRVPKEEFALSKNQQFPQIGDIVDVYVEKIEGRNGRTILSREKAIREESWVHLETACDKGEFVNGVIFGRVKGGFTVDLSGVVAFLPGSQVDVRPIKDMSALMGIVQPFQILKMDKKLGNIVVSRRAILEESRSEARDEMLSKIKEGMVLEGVVKNITDYGAFIDLGSLDGLLHVTDISWSRINHPSEILALGQKVKVMVIKFHEDTKRISLGMKQLDDNPWQNIKEEFPVGKIMTGKVANIADYGAFIELKDGIEGLVHSSEISWIKSTQHPKKLLTIGQEVQFIILEIDTDKHRISLSIKQCNENPLVKFAVTHPVGSILRAPIRNITDFGMFVAIDENIDGMIHETDISWDGKGTELLKSYAKGDIVECKVLSIDIEKERISLGIKQLKEELVEVDELDEFKKGQALTCVVTAIKEDGIEVNINDKASGVIKKAELSSDKIDQKPERFVAGDRVDAKVISVDKSSRKVVLSIKALEIEERTKAIKEYGSADSGASLGDILGMALGKDN